MRNASKLPLLLPLVAVFALDGAAATALAKPGAAAKPRATKGPRATAPTKAQVAATKIELAVSPDLGDLGPDWRKAFGFTDHTARFDFRWQTNLGTLSGVSYRVEDGSGTEIASKSLTGGKSIGLFSINLADLPKHDKYVIHVEASNASDSNTVTLTKAEPTEIPWGFASFSVDGIRQDFGVPGLSVAVSCNPGKTIEWASGTRRVDSTVLVQDGDRWHIGSNTKSMTATMIGKLVEEGTLSWNTSVWDLVYGPLNLFPELKTGSAKIHERFKDVTIEHLASHRSGMKMKSSEDSPTRKLENYAKDPRTFRWETVSKLLTRDHTGIIGEWRYGNGNYMLLGVIIERLRGKPYEQVIQQEIFTPAGMTTARFGMPTDVALSSSPAGNPWVVQTDNAYDVDTTKQPNGHLGASGGPKVDNLALPPVWNPAGGVYLSGADMLKFLRVHIDGKSGSLTLAKSTRDKLHSIYTKSDRAMGPSDAAAKDQGDPDYGWAFGQWTDGSDGRVLGHDGTYFRFYSSMRVYLDRGFAVTVSANLEGGDYNGDNAVGAARNWAVGAAKKWCKKPTIKKGMATKARVRGARNKPPTIKGIVDGRTDFDPIPPKTLIKRQPAHRK